jgi:rod shape determining protein RodA
MGPFFSFRILRRLDWLILASALALTAIGLLSIYSATHNADVFVKFQKQVVWVVLGLLFLGLLLLPPPRFYHYSAYLVYAASIFLLVLVLFFGRKVAGNAGWFGIGGFGIQPSEFGKVATILALSRFLSDRSTNLSTFRDQLIAIGIVFVPWALIFFQPDFGTGLVYWLCFLPMIFWAGAEMILLLTLVSPVLIAIISVLNMWYFLAAALIISAIFYLLKRNIGVALLFLVLNLSVGFGVEYLYSHLPEYQRGRIAVFLDPARAPKAASYNIVQSKVAIGSGGLTGRGYLQGSQTQLRFVPEQWTDFIFCVPAEEFGFIGAFTTIGIFCLLFLRGIRLARDSTFRFVSAEALGLTTMLVTHTFVNIGMNLGLLPVVGIPLPFMSYGGSFFLTCMIAVGLLLHASMHREEFE